MTGEIKTREELAGLVTSPFALGQQPQNQDFQNLLASILFPKEDDAAGLAADPATAALWLSYFAEGELPQDATGRHTLVGLINRLLVWTAQRLVAPQLVSIGSGVAYVDADTFTITSDVTANLVAGTRVRARLGGTYVYGTVATATWNGVVTNVNLTMDAGNALTSALNLVEMNLLDIVLIGAGLGLQDADITALYLIAKLGFTPANKAGETFTGQVAASKFVANGGAPYGKLTVGTSVPGPADGVDGDIWLVHT